jgi:hypothetical protein
VVYDTAAVDWGPLERFLVAASERGVAAPDADEFMWIGRCELRDGPVVHLYKHVDSRRCLNVDYAGFTYRYCGGDAGAYEPFASPPAALDHVIGSPGGKCDAHCRPVGGGVVLSAAGPLARPLIVDDVMSTGVQVRQCHAVRPVAVCRRRCVLARPRRAETAFVRPESGGRCDCAFEGERGPRHRCLGEVLMDAGSQG